MITGRNGSGKTSVLDALARFLESLTDSLEDCNMSTEAIRTEKEYLYEYSNIIPKWNCSLYDVYRAFISGQFITAYYKTDREFEAVIPAHVEKVLLKKYYLPAESPRMDFVKYLLDMKVTEAMALSSGKKEKAEGIRTWFAEFQKLLCEVFEDDSIKLIFEEDTFQFHLEQAGKESFDFNTLSSGYGAVLDIIVDLMIRMEKYTEKKFQYDLPGLVLIDEIETHLHLELQKKILKILMTVFPNIQFVVSTHAPFILGSVESAVIFDLEKRICVTHGLWNIPYDGIVEGYFQVEKLSKELKEKYIRYKILTEKKYLTDADFAEIARLEVYLDEIPDYLALEFTTEYQRRKLEFEQREDIL